MQLHHVRPRRCVFTHKHRLDILLASTIILRFGYHHWGCVKVKNGDGSGRKNERTKLSSFSLNYIVVALPKFESARNARWRLSDLCVPFWELFQGTISNIHYHVWSWRNESKCCLWSKPQYGICKSCYHKRGSCWWKRENGHQLRRWHEWAEI